jgi:hypothetical protein
MNSINENGIIIHIMSFLDKNSCCKNSSVFNFGITNKNHLKLLKTQNVFLTKLSKYFKLTNNTKNLLNKDLDIFCTNCYEIDIKGLECLLGQCKANFLKNDDIDYPCYRSINKNYFYIHFECKHESTKFKSDCISYFPNIAIGNTCCSGKGFEIIFK